MSSPRVASWLYHVINVFIDAFTAEKGLLERGNTSWRFYNQKLEFLLPSGAYLSHNGQHILRDLIFEQPEIAVRLQLHDEARNKLERAATDAAATVLATPGFRELVNATRTRFLVEHPDARPTGAYPVEKHPDLVAEYIVNKIEQLPSHYTDAEFWTLHGNELRAAAPSLPELERVRNEMIELDQDALSWLTKLSLDLCKKFDVPAAPSGSFGY